MPDGSVRTWGNGRAGWDVHAPTPPFSKVTSFRATPKKEAVASSESTPTKVAPVNFTSMLHKIKPTAVAPKTINGKEQKVSGSVVPSKKETRSSGYGKRSVVPKRGGFQPPRRSKQRGVSVDSLPRESVAIDREAIALAEADAEHNVLQAKLLRLKEVDPAVPIKSEPAGAQRAAIPTPHRFGGAFLAQFEPQEKEIEVRHVKQETIDHFLSGLDDREEVGDPFCAGFLASRV